MNREAELNDQDRKNIEKGSQKLAEEFKELENSLESFYKDILPETQEIYKKMFFLKGASNSGRWSWGTWWNLIDVKGGFHIGIDIFNKYTGDQERISVDTRSIVLNTDTFKQFLFSQGIEWKSTSLIIHTIFFDIKDKYNSFTNRIQYIDSIKRELQEKNQKVKDLTRQVNKYAGNRGSLDSIISRLIIELKETKSITKSKKIADIRKELEDAHKKYIIK